MWKTLVKIPIVLWGDWLWSLRLNSAQKLKFTPFWACRHEKSPPIEVKFSKIGPQMHLVTFEVPFDLGLDWPWSSVSFLISNLFFSTNVCVSYSFASVCIYLVRPSPAMFPIPHGSAHTLILLDRRTGSRHGPWNGLVYILVRPSEFSQRRLGDWHWILQVPDGFCQIINTSYAKIVYGNIRQSPKQQQNSAHQP